MKDSIVEHADSKFVAKYKYLYQCVECGSIESEDKKEAKMVG